MMLGLLRHSVDHSINLQAASPKDAKGHHYKKRCHHTVTLCLPLACSNKKSRDWIGIYMSQYVVTSMPCRKKEARDEDICGRHNRRAGACPLAIVAPERL